MLDLVYMIDTHTRSPYGREEYDVYYIHTVGLIREHIFAKLSAIVFFAKRNELYSYHFLQKLKKKKIANIFTKLQKKNNSSQLLG